MKRRESKWHTAWGPAGHRIRSRRLRLLCLAASVVALASTLGIGVASATYVHPAPSGSFGPDGTSGSIFEDTTYPGSHGVSSLAIDEARHRLYVLNNQVEKLSSNEAAPRLYAFDISSPGSHTPVSGFPVGGLLGSGPGNPLYPALAVDNSGGSDGYVYAAPGKGTIVSFNPDGSKRDFSVAGRGVDVDSSGHVWAVGSKGSLDVYTSGGELVDSVSSVDQDITERLVVDRSTGDVYVGGQGGYSIWKYPAAGGYNSSALFLSKQWFSLAFDSAHQVLYILKENKVEAYDSDGVLVEEFATGIVPGSFAGSFGGIAVDESTGTVYLSNRKTDQVVELPGLVAPEASTGDQIGKFAVSGDVDPVGAGDVTNCQFQFGETTDYGKAETCQPAIPPSYAGPTAVEASLPALVPETTYHYRLAASNSNGTAYGRDRTITPHWVDRLQTEAATGVGRFTASLNASFLGSKEETHYFFEWGTEEGEYTSQSAVAPGVSAGITEGSTSLSATASGLMAGTTYHYRVVASNSGGVSLGEDRTFETLPAVLDIHTDAASGIGANSVTLNASFTGTEQGTHYYFEWGRTKANEHSTTEEVAGVGNSGLSTPVSAAVADELEQATTYHYRVVAQNSSGTSFGNDETFTTTPAVASVTTEAPSAVSFQSMTLNGSFVGNGEDTHYYFEWGPTTSYGNFTATPPGPSAGAPVGPAPTPLSATVTEFKGFTTYHYRLVASNDAGTTYGGDRTVSTLPAMAPGITATSVSGVAPTSASVAASVIPNRWDTLYLFEYGPTADYGFSTLTEGPVGSDIASYPISAELKGLTPGTAYHFRAVAINFAGTTYGPDRQFATPGAPRIDSISAFGVGQTTVRLGALAAANASSTGVRFDYGLSAAYGQSTASMPIGVDLLARGATVDLTGLAPGTTYHFRAVAANGIGTASSGDQTFTTLDAVAPDGTGASKCKKGFVRRKHRCVKKKHKHRSSHRRGAGNRG